MPGFSLWFTIPQLHLIGKTLFLNKVTSQVWGFNIDTLAAAVSLQQHLFLNTAPPQSKTLCTFELTMAAPGVHFTLFQP